MWSPTNESRWRPLARLLVRLVHSWWQGDRIRISPARGRLLRLTPPCFLLVNGEPVEVIRRKLLTDGRTVYYACRTRSGRGKLVVKLGKVGEGLCVFWRQQGTAVPLCEAEVEVFSS